MNHSIRNVSLARAGAVLVVLALGAAIAWVWQSSQRYQARDWTFSAAAYGPSATSDDLREESFTTAAELLNAFPAEPTAIAVSARLTYSLGQSQKAEQYWQESIQLDPQFVNGHYALGVIAEDNADFEQASHYYRAVLKLAPGDAHATPRLAEALFHLRRFEEAAAVLEAYKDSQAVDAKAISHLGHSYFELGRYDQAQEIFEVMIQMYPDVPSALSTAYHCLYRIHSKRGDSGRAAECLEKFLKHRPVDSENVKERQSYQDIDWMSDLLVTTLWESGQVYRELGRPDAAEAAWQKAIHLDEKHRGAHLALLSLYEEAERHADGLAIAQQLCKIEPQNADHWLATALLSARVQRVEDALEAIQLACEMRPGNPVYQQAREQILLMR